MFRIAFYKATSAGIPGIYNVGVRLWTNGPYSHCELVFSDGVSASASFKDGGVRFKEIDYDPAKWDFVELPSYLEKDAKEWFESHDGLAYDVLGNIHFVMPIVDDSKTKWYCSEACAQALGINESWRLHPNALHAMLLYCTTIWNKDTNGNPNIASA